MDRPVLLIAAIVVLLLAARLLSIRRLTWRSVAQTLVSWAAIGLIAIVALNHREELSALVAKVSERFGYEQQSVVGDTVRIRMAADGHFWVRARVNGVERRFLIDSGATYTAMSDEAAEALGVEAQPALPMMIQTANGTIEAARGSIARLDVGPLSTRNLGVVVSPAFGDVEVLGMNFLSRLKSWRVEGKTLVLEPARGKDAAHGDSTRKPKAGHRAE